MQTTDVKALARRLTRVKADVVKNYPFFGRLILRLRLGFAECGTAYTDMKRIVFDPSFANRLSDGELSFVFLHEVLHCVFKHCIRGRGKNNLLFNIACDIVVNSTILEMLGASDFSVDGEGVMHLTPQKKEGRKYTAEQVYKMLMKSSTSQLENQYPSGFDSHDAWKDVDPISEGAVWDNYIKEATKACGNTSGIPLSIKRHLDSVNRKSLTDWRHLLHNYIRHDRSDYIYSVPDRRFDSDIIMPSFQYNITGAKTDGLWFFIDTSGSVSDREVAEAFFEIRQAVEQIDSLSGVLYFFDCELSEPVRFESVTELEKAEIAGGGGTSYMPIFELLKNTDPEEYPKVIIIITDGYAYFPAETHARGVPVIWLITSEVKPEWGQTVYLKTEEEF